MDKVDLRVKLLLIANDFWITRDGANSDDILKTARQMEAWVLEGAEEPKQADYLDMLVEDMDIQVRARRILQEHGLRTVRDLIQKTVMDLLKLPGFGRRALHDVEGELGKHNLRLLEQ